MRTFRHLIDHPEEIAIYLQEKDGNIPSNSTAAKPGPDADIEKGRFLGGDEEIEIHVNGIPERKGRKSVLKLFKDWSEDSASWTYDEKYTEFAKRYPRVTGGHPRDEWVAKKDNDEQTEGITCCGRYNKIRREDHKSEDPESTTSL